MCVVIIWHLTYDSCWTSLGGLGFGSVYFSRRTAVLLLFASFRRFVENRIGINFVFAFHIESKELFYFRSANKTKTVVIGIIIKQLIVWCKIFLRKRYTDWLRTKALKQKKRHSPIKPTKVLSTSAENLNQKHINKTTESSSGLSVIWFGWGAAGGA